MDENNNPEQPEAGASLEGEERPNVELVFDPDGATKLKFAGSESRELPWYPGVVAVELVEGTTLKASDLAELPDAWNRFSEEDRLVLKEIDEKYGKPDCELPFGGPTEGFSEATSDSAPQEVVEPDLRNFITLFFNPDADVPDIVSRLRRLSVVHAAAPIPKSRPPGGPLQESLVGTSDSVHASPKGIEHQWYIHRCKIDEAWAMATGKNVVIADIDYGFRVTHIDLDGRLNLERAYNSFDGGNVVTHGERIAHGTGVMGQVGAGVNGVGMAGVAFEAELWPLQANSGPGTPIDKREGCAGLYAWAKAIEHVRSEKTEKRKVILLENEAGDGHNVESDPHVNGAIRRAIRCGIVVCVPAGNEGHNAGKDPLGNPITPTGSVLVGATDYDRNQRFAGVRFSSNWGDSIVVSAPGDESHDVTCSGISDGAYCNNFGGTSGAAAKVAGVIALMLEVNPDLTPSQVRDILHRTGSEIVVTDYKPIGTFLDAQAAVCAAARERAASGSGGHDC